MLPNRWLAARTVGPPTGVAEATGVRSRPRRATGGIASRVTGTCLALQRACNRGDSPGLSSRGVGTNLEYSGASRRGRPGGCGRQERGRRGGLARRAGGPAAGAPARGSARPAQSGVFPHVLAVRVARACASPTTTASSTTSSPFATASSFDLASTRSASSAMSRSIVPASAGSSAISIRRWPRTSWSSTRPISRYRMRRAISSCRSSSGDVHYHAWRPGGAPLNDSVTIGSGRRSRCTGRDERARACRRRPALSSAGASAQAQSVTAEADVTVGHSTENIDAAAAQLRLFGSVKADGGSTGRSPGRRCRRARRTRSARPIPTTGSSGPSRRTPRRCSTRRELVGLRPGDTVRRSASSSQSDQAYSGFLRAPLIRYGDYFALSNTFLESGADFLAGTSSLFVEGSVGVPQDQGSSRRARGVDAVVRVQGYAHLPHRSARATSTAGRARPAISSRGACGSAAWTCAWTRRHRSPAGEWIQGRALHRRGATRRLCRRNHPSHRDGTAHARRAGRADRLRRGRLLDVLAAADDRRADPADAVGAAPS